jgi:molybdate transport repressor ModE-like protein
MHKNAPDKATCRSPKPDPKPIRLRPRGKLAELDPQVRLTFINGGQNDYYFFCKGCSMLLRGIADTGSLNKAAKNIGMGFAPASQRLKEAERGFGFALYEGKPGRGSALTPLGAKILRIYESCEHEIQKQANRIVKAEWAKDE